MDTEMEAYILIGILTTAIFSVEVAVYAILPSIASRIGRYVERARSEDLKKEIEDLEDSLNQFKKDSNNKQMYTDLKYSIKKLGAPIRRAKFITNWTRIYLALALPGSFSILSLVSLFLGFFGIFDLDIMALLSLSLVILSIVAEVPVLIVIDRVITWRDYTDVEELKKVEADLKAKETTTTGYDRDMIIKFLNKLELSIKEESQEYIERYRSGETCIKPGVYICDNCGTSITISKEEIFPPCPHCGDTQWAK